MIQINNCSKHFGAQVLFEDVTLSVGCGEKIGLVGRNGSGKSTLIRMILGDISSDSGNISIPKNYKVGCIEQHLKFSKNTVLEECIEVLKGDEIYDSYKVEKILFGLGFTREDLEKHPQTFSGGFQIRINLAKVLSQNQNMLLLDEPSNYLDIVSLRWLRSFLKSFSGEFILITHDRDFMDSVTTHTMGIVRKQIKKIKGSTKKFFEQIKQEDEVYEKTRINLENKRKDIEDFVTKFKAKATKAAQAQSKMKLLEKIGTMDKLTDEKDLNFRFNYFPCPAKALLNVENLAFSYDGKREIFKNLSFTVGAKERIAIIGKNGKGKSTLLNVLASELEKTKGDVTSHPALKIGHFGQTNIQRLTENSTVFNEVSLANIDLSQGNVRSICGSMMFSGNLVDKKIKVLSGGERSRVLLGKIIANATNLLLLDEPTNHLDVESIDILFEKIKEYPGAVMMVSHSEDLLEKFATKLIVFHRDKCEFFEGNYGYFLEKIGWEDEDFINKLPEGERSKYSKKDQKRLRSELIKERSRSINPLKQEMDELEKFILQAEKELKDANDYLIHASKTSKSDEIKKYSKLISEIEKSIEIAFSNLETTSTKHDELCEFYRQKSLEIEE